MQKHQRPLHCVELVLLRFQKHLVRFHLYTQPNTHRSAGDAQSMVALHLRRRDRVREELPLNPILSLSRTRPHRLIFLADRSISTTKTRVRCACTTRGLDLFFCLNVVCLSKSPTKLHFHERLFVSAGHAPHKKREAALCFGRESQSLGPTSTKETRVQYVSTVQCSTLFFL